MGIVSITFDEGRESQFEKAFPILEKEGMRATVYLLTGYIGISWSIQNLETRIINERQVKRLLKNDWEIASHTSNHSNVVFASERRARKEFERSKKKLSEIGVEKSGIAYPGGAISQKNYGIVKNYFTYGREANNSNWQDLNVLNLNDIKEIDRFRLRGNVIGENCVGRLNLEEYFKEIRHQNKWIILVFHEIEEKVTNKDDGISLAYFNEIIKLIKKYNLKVETIAQVMEEFQLPVLEHSSDEFMTMADYAERNFGKKWLSLPLFVCYRFPLLEKILKFVLRINALNPLYWFIKNRNENESV